MALTETTSFIEVRSPNLSEVMPAFVEALRLRGFDVQHCCLADKVWELQLTKGSQLMQLAGLQVGLKLQVWPEYDGVAVRMSPNLLKRQGIQAAVLYFVCMPALLLPAWGLLQQHKLDAEVLELLTRCLNHNPIRQV